MFRTMKKSSPAAPEGQERVERMSNTITSCAAEPLFCFTDFLLTETYFCFTLNIKDSFGEIFPDYTFMVNTIKYNNTYKFHLEMPIKFTFSKNSANFFFLLYTNNIPIYTLSGCKINDFSTIIQQIVKNNRDFLLFLFF